MIRDEFIPQYWEALVVTVCGVIPLDFITMSAPSIRVDFGCLTTEGSDATAWISPVIVNETFVRQNFERENPLGRHLHGLGSEETDSEIIGVVGDAKDQSLRRDVNATVYVPQKGGSANFEVRTASNPLPLIPAIRDTVAQLDSNLPVFSIKTQSEQIERSLFQERMIARLSSFFGGLSLLLWRRRWGQTLYGPAPPVGELVCASLLAG
jgi:hypothetical protein